MRSIKFASQNVSGCVSLPWESEQGIQENVSENKNKWFQPSIARSSRYKDMRCSSEAEEDNKNPNQTSVFSRLGQNANRIHKPLAEQDQAFSSLTVKNGEKRKAISFGRSGTSSSTSLLDEISQINSGRPHTVRERTLSCGACKKGGRPRACRHHIKEHEGSRSQFQQESVGKFEDQSESKPFRVMTKDVNLFRSGSRIYGGLGRQMDWTCREETCRKAAERLPESDEAEPRHSTVTYDKNVSGINDKKEYAETAKIVDINANQNFQEGNLLTDIFTSFSDGLSDDFDETSLCQDSQNLHNHALQSLQSDSKRKECSQNQSVTGCSNQEEDSAQLEMVRNNSTSKFCVNRTQNTENFGFDSSDVQIHAVVDDLEEGEIVGASYIEAIRTEEENEVQIDEALCMNFNLSKSHTGNSRGLFEAESLKPSSQETNLHHKYCTQGEKRQKPMLPKRTSKSDFMCRDGAGYHRSAKTFMRYTRSFPRISGDVRVGGKYWDTDLDKPHSKTVLTDNVSRNGFTALDVEVKKQEHNRDLRSPNKYVTYHSGKENVGIADYGFTNDAHKSKLDRCDQQSKSFSMEFKEKCSIKPSAKRELVLDADQIIKAPEVQNLLNRKFEMMYDDDTGSKSKNDEKVQRAMGKWNKQSRNLLQVETHGESEQVVREKENPASPLHTWRRASKVAKIAEGCPHHKVSKEMSDSNKDSHDAAVSCKGFVEDFSEKFRVKRHPCIQKKPKEQDSHRLNQRLRQINFGKNTLGYERYLDLVPRFKRGKSDPHTPDIHQVCSKRSWDGQVSKWRRCLHFYDPPVQEDEEFPEAIGIFKVAGNNVEVHEENANDSFPAEQQEVKDSDLSIYGDWMDFGPADEELFQDTGMVDTSYTDEHHNSSPNVGISSTV